MRLRLPFLRTRSGRHPRRQQHFADHLLAIHTQSIALRNFTDRQLTDIAERVRGMISADDTLNGELLIEIFALSMEAIRRTLGITLYDVQLQAAWALTHGEVAEMQTGEGKTISAVPAAAVHGLMGRGVHVVTTNPYLANRDYQQLRPVYELLGLSVGLLPEQHNPPAKSVAYQCDITYGTGYEFGFDYLRDQVALQGRSSPKLGRSLVAALRGAPNHDRCSVVQRGHAFAIVDEIDNVLIDDASSPLVLSDGQDTRAIDAEAYLQARSLIPRLQPEEHYHLAAAGAMAELSAAGRERIYATDIDIPVSQLRRPWTEYVEQALRAEFLCRRDVHYVVQDQRVQIVDASTGRIFADRTWRDGLHQAIEAKENLPITTEKGVLAQVTRQRYFQLYDCLAGMTGTAVGCEREFRSVYGLHVATIPVRVPSRRVVLPLRSFSCDGAKQTAILQDIQTMHRTGRPILVGTHSIAESERLADSLQRCGLTFQLLNGRQDAAEAEVISAAGEEGAITLSTNIAGRGTDIRLARQVDQLGGLHVIVCAPSESRRIDRQLIGRCARQGDPGSAAIFMSADDLLVQRYGAWLQAPMTKTVAANGEIPTDLSSRVRRLQLAAERSGYAARAALLRRDLQRDTLLDPTSS